MSWYVDKIIQEPNTNKILRMEEIFKILVDDNKCYVMSYEEYLSMSDSSLRDIRQTDKYEIKQLYLVMHSKVKSNI